MVAIQLNEGFSWRRYLRWLDLRRQVGIWPPSLTALFLQSVALGMVDFGVAPLLALAGWPVSIWLLASVTGLIAFGLSAGLGLARWWWFIQLLFAPLLALFLSWHLAPSWYLAVFLILLLFYWSTFRSQAPLYLSGKEIGRAHV